MAAITAFDAAILTNKIKTEMFNAAVGCLGQECDEFVEAIAEALKHVDKRDSMMTKLMAIARHCFMFGYFTALEDFQGLQQELIDEAERGTLEDDFDG